MRIIVAWPRVIAPTDKLRQHKLRGYGKSLIWYLPLFVAAPRHRYQVRNLGAVEVVYIPSAHSKVTRFFPPHLPITFSFLPFIFQPFEPFS